METIDLLNKIRLLEIKTKGLTNQFFSGKYHSTFKGSGMTFSEVREYQNGDEVRTIDWNVTARFNSPHVKVFEEERELLVMLLVDISESTKVGLHEKSKKELALELMAVIAFSALANNDKVGALFISDGVEKFIAPSKGKKHILFILRTFIELKPIHTKTNLNKGLEFFRNTLKKRSICFVISDFIDEHRFEDGLTHISKKHELIALRIKDLSEDELPDLGLIQLINAEDNSTSWVNTSNKQVRIQFKAQKMNHEARLESCFKRIGVTNETIYTTDDYIPTLIKLFKRHK